MHIGDERSSVRAYHKERIRPARQTGLGSQARRVDRVHRADVVRQIRQQESSRGIRQQISRSHEDGGLCIRNGNAGATALVRVASNAWRYKTQYWNLVMHQ